MVDSKIRDKRTPRNQPALMAGTLWFIALIFCIVFHLYTLLDLLFWGFLGWSVMSITYLWHKSFSSKQWSKVELINIETGLFHKTLDVNLVYSYQFKGKHYRGNRVQYPFLYYKADLKIDVFDAIRAGVIKHAYINPDHPSQSVLLKGYGRGDVAFMVLISLFFGLWGFVYHLVLTQRVV